MIYANDNDAGAAYWLSRLPIRIDRIDSRSIAEVRGDDLRGFDQCHFFAGIAGWPLALQMAGWPDDASVWTGSCPCQPFSNAGRGRGTDDERHLWPEFRRLIDECRPSTVFGEQVASKSGREWFSSVRADLEALGYAVGGADLCAAGVGAPHIRQRLFWVAYRIDAGREGRISRGSDSEWEVERRCLGRCGTAWSDAEFMPCRDGKARPVKPGLRCLAHGIPGRVAQLRGLGNAIVPQVAAEFVVAFMGSIGMVR
jgi:DNA (cytosine-5)-methyltransferase 1